MALALTRLITAVLAGVVGIPVAMVVIALIFVPEEVGHELPAVQTLLAPGGSFLNKTKRALCFF